MKQVTILAGVSGAGKTFLRQKSYLAELPYLDMADLRDEFPELEWAPLFEIFLKRLRGLLAEHDHVVVEGYFLPGKKSTRMLLDDLAVVGAEPQIIRLWAPLYVCRDRLEEELDNGGDSIKISSRSKALSQCWRPE